MRLLIDGRVKKDMLWVETQASASFRWEYCALLVLSTVLAAFSAIADSAVLIIATMIITPLMQLRVLH